MKLSHVLAFGLVLFSICNASSESKQVQSDAYWMGEARPFGILYSSDWNGNLTIVVKNQEISAISIDAITLSEKSTYGTNADNNAVSSANPNIILNPSEIKTISITHTNECEPARPYEYWVNFIYSSNGKTEAKQFGAKSLVGWCKQASQMDIAVTNFLGAPATRAFPVAIMLFGVVAALIFISISLSLKHDIKKIFDKCNFELTLFFIFGLFIFVIHLLLSDMEIWDPPESYVLIVPVAFLIGKKAFDTDSDGAHSFLSGGLGGLCFALGSYSAEFGLPIFLLYSGVPLYDARPIISILVGCGLSGAIAWMSYNLLRLMKK